MLHRHKETKPETKPEVAKTNGVVAHTMTDELRREKALEFAKALNPAATQKADEFIADAAQIETYLRDGAKPVVP